MKDQASADINQHNDELPRHVAIIMDGNNRWARKRELSGREGHKAGQLALETIIEHCGQLGIEVLTVYAFSSENWRRSEEEVAGLMHLFAEAIESKAGELGQRGVQIRFVGDLSAFDEALQQRMLDVMHRTASNNAAVLQVCINYGGHWDIAEACRKLAARTQAGELEAADIDAALVQQNIVGGDLPMPDLCIRTGGELRLSNFLLWQLAYAELYFSDILWPDFDVADFEEALSSYRDRQRRFGGSGEQPGGSKG